MGQESTNAALSEGVWVNSANWLKIQDALQMNGLGKFDHRSVKLWRP